VFGTRSRKKNIFEKKRGIGGEGKKKRGPGAKGKAESWGSPRRAVQKKKKNTKEGKIAKGNAICVEGTQGGPSQDGSLSRRRKPADLASTFKRRSLCASNQESIGARKLRNANLKRGIKIMKKYARIAVMATKRP